MKILNRPLGVAVVAVAIAALVALRVLSSFDMDPTGLVGFGVDLVEVNEYAEENLKREVTKRATLGHDGKYFFVQSNDPLVLEPEKNISVVDRPLYRSQRMLYPLLAGGAGLFSPNTILWALLIVNLLAMGVGTWAVSAIAMEMGGSPRWGLAFVLNLGFISEMTIDGAGVVAAAAAFWAVALIMKGRIGWGIACLTLAALSRETMLLAAAGSAYWLWRNDERRVAGLSLLVPVTAVSMWALYLRIRIGWDAGVSEIQEIGLPFAGFIDAFHLWRNDLIDLVAGIVIMVLFLQFTRRVLVSRLLVGWAFLGFVPLGLLFTRQVWQSYFDITRAVAPIITAFVLLVFLSQGSEDKKHRERTGVRG